MGADAAEKFAGRRREPAIGLVRAPHAGQFPLARLLQLVVLLQSDRYPNARQLAEMCEVSRRTIYRDLATLADAGITVLYHPDRQGYQLARSLFLQPLRLEEREALGLLILARQWEPRKDLGLGRETNRAIDKLMQALPKDLRERLLGVSDLVSERAESGEADSRGSPIYRIMLEALLQRRQIRIWVRVGESEGLDATKLGIYRLTRLHGDWCVVGRSTRHCRVALFRLDHIERLELTDDTYTIPPRFDLKRFLGQAKAEPLDYPAASSG